MGESGRDIEQVLGTIHTTDVTRRGFMMTTLAIGFALAIKPVSAETLTTDAAGLAAGEVKIPTSDGSIPAYRAMPSKGRAFPVVVVVQEIFGVHEHIKDVCRRLAKLGYLAVAPELYARQGAVSKLTDVNDIITKVVSKVPDAQVMADLDATVAWVKESGEGNVEKLGVTGFCWGGRIVWLYAAHNPRAKAAVAWYGRLVGKPSELQPKHPIDIAASLKVPVLGLYGGDDQGIPLDTVEQMRKALQEAGSPSEIVVYPNTPHGFHADYRASYRKEQAEDGWRRLQAWFKQHGVA
ncbi:MAG: dienelactone hydrolase family protein [Nitrospirae bacterium]|nr:MAG: dienelactone hydrolase family protein [Nitrospirota bacterium]